MQRFVILTHDHPLLHWDFLLENGSTCRTWRLISRPDTHEPILAESLPDHRSLYLEYEGPVSGDRGTVTRWDSGTFDWIVDEPNLVSVRLRGRTLNTRVRLTRHANGKWDWGCEDEQ